MPAATQKIFFAMLIVMGLVSQPLAEITMPCPMASSHTLADLNSAAADLNSAAADLNTAIIDHTGHNMPDMEAGNYGAVTECCGEGLCPMMTCSTTAVICHIAIPPAFRLSGDSADSYRFSRISSYLSLPFRPPILP